MIECVTVQRDASNNLSMWWNGALIGTTSGHTVNYTTNWSKFQLFTDGSSFFSGNMTAMRLTHAARYAYNTSHNAMLHGFPESG